MPDHTISDRPRTHPGVPVYAGALDAEYGVDSPKPLDRNGVPGVEVDVLIDTEDDRRGIRTTGGFMQPQRCACIFDPAVEAACEIRRRRSAGLAALEVADDMQARNA